MSQILQVANLSHRYPGVAQDVLADIGLDIGSGELVTLSGASGCGKTTLLLACGAMQKPSEGSVKICGQEVFKVNTGSRCQIRANQVGYLFQTLQLVPYLNVLENVCVVRGVNADAARFWLGKLGLQDRLRHKPNALSHGQRQRVALARAIVHRPALLVADEPTGNLDPGNTELVFQTIREFADDGGAVLLASHNPLVRSFAQRSYELFDSKLNPASTVA